MRARESERKRATVRAQESEWVRGRSKRGEWGRRERERAREREQRDKEREGEWASEWASE